MDEHETNLTGTGGGLRYVAEEADPSMVSQEQGFSCQIACARQLLKDAGVEISEADLTAEIGYLEGYGSLAAPTGKALDNLHPRLRYLAGPIEPEMLTILVKRDPWIASLATEHGTIHAVIVDKLEGDILHVRDPWGPSGPGSETGTRATIRIGDFLQHWDLALNYAVFPHRIK